MAIPENRATIARVLTGLIFSLPQLNLPSDTCIRFIPAYVTTTVILFMVIVPVLSRQSV